ncbi:MAG: type II toxin-antitoxin system prevent-host-death family antitoxin [Gemmatimonadota bacterium]
MIDDRDSTDSARAADAVAASDVKNAWHRYIDRVSQAREVIVVTRYGKPIMKLSPVDEAEEAPGVFGILSGTVTVHDDIIAPIDDVWEANG